ncbi:Mss4-like protein [Hyaloscypha sp. PMI_1271]|nr:Mss4-like protein [Hyaloscypha sp. PMI_1271]
MAATADRSEPYFPLAGLASDGWSNENEATATCLCGAVQLAFPLPDNPGFVTTFICNCTDCRKITASMFASNFTVLSTHLRHLRGQSNLRTFKQSHTIGSHQNMTNYFCGTCGGLMYRIGERFERQVFMRIGTVDDFTLQETKLYPRVEQFTKDRVSWVKGFDEDERVTGGRYRR